MQYQNFVQVFGQPNLQPIYFVGAFIKAKSEL